LGVNPTMAVVILFVLSLTGALVLFRFLKSSALIKGRSYQAGGALAGFVIIYYMVSSFYYKIDTDRSKNEELSAEIEQLKKELKNLDTDIVSGEVEPDKQPVKVRLVFDAVEPDSEGKFNFQVPHVVLQSPTAALYAITDDDHVIIETNCDQPPCQVPESSIYLYETKLNDIRIPMRLKKR
jgi:hypothetical protein